ncbi:arabinan endo-1,5-alpha-L-arabinosidase [Mariniphaga anaerophila]|uniref:Arabinan endo-1,5-alpha-L-arabinosidase n=1 Tax=Mariniphaga anaerophila TaxID=1484053 RepID=A0A1M4W217_9BACT|nr:family 43 glycosylhydrolase [Mariniphaga anaerophila]SHE75278.1 arabinan endo-1,5-alpha-L-arabinosidase [Mariniphaga anaerophila]
MKTRLFALALILFTLSLSSCNSDSEKKEKPSNENITTTYKNPVVSSSFPDPTIIKANDGYFYLYATEDIHNTPILQSKNLVDWKLIGTAFTEETRPNWEPNSGIWAPDINYINGQYVLYYSLSVWGGEWTCGIGIATAEQPDGPFTDRGQLFRSNTIGVKNSIDPFYWEENGKKYLTWGSFRGIYCIELADDGLSIRSGAEKIQISGTAIEGSYIYKKGNYYYLFGSAGTCCEGANSTYKTVVARSEKLIGPYVDKTGKSMMENNYEVVIQGNDVFVGTGHNSEIITDDEGNEWIFYHAYFKSNPDKGRVLLMDQIHWINEWPVVTNQSPSSEATAPVFN